VRAWLDRHERFVFHFTPTSCSWLNAVEGYFAKLSKQRLKRGVFRSVVDLQEAINRYLAETNQAPKPFTWTADPDKIIAAVKRGHQVLDSIPLAADVSSHNPEAFGAPKYILLIKVLRTQIRSRTRLVREPRPDAIPPWNALAVASTTQSSFSRR